MSSVVGPQCCVFSRRCVRIALGTPRPRSSGPAVCSSAVGNTAPYRMVPKDPKQCVYDFIFLSLAGGCLGSFASTDGVRSSEETKNVLDMGGIRLGT